MRLSKVIQFSDCKAFSIILTNFFWDLIASKLAWKNNQKMNHVR